MEKEVAELRSALQGKNFFADQLSFLLHLRGLSFLVVLARDASLAKAAADLEQARLENLAAKESEAKLHAEFEGMSLSVEE